uniref:TSC22 domain family protein 3 n=1 Tax=Pongo abelii TaxID=9601 RepID=A0A8I5TNC0_PONAB
GTQEGGGSPPLWDPSSKRPCGRCAVKTSCCSRRGSRRQRGGGQGPDRAGQGAGRAPCAAWEKAGSLPAEKEFLASFRAGASGASVVAIDNKIEQAMDLVKNHLMYAVREEVEILKEQIRELVEKNSQLERENTLLKTLASPEQLEKFQSCLSPEEPAPESPQVPEAPGGSAV